VWVVAQTVDGGLFRDGAGGVDEAQFTGGRGQHDGQGVVDHRVSEDIGDVGVVQEDHALSGC
jgi:hypothetical protein